MKKKLSRGKSARRTICSLVRCFCRFEKKGRKIFPAPLRGVAFSCSLDGLFEKNREKKTKSWEKVAENLAELQNYQKKLQVPG